MPDSGETGADQGLDENHENDDHDADRDLREDFDAFAARYFAQVPLEDLERRSAASLAGCGPLALGSRAAAPAPALQSSACSHRSAKTAGTRATPSSRSSTTTCPSSSTRSRWNSNGTISGSISSCTRSCASNATPTGRMLGIRPATDGAEVGRDARVVPLRRDRPGDRSGTARVARTRSRARVARRPRRDHRLAQDAGAAPQRRRRARAATAADRRGRSRRGHGAADVDGRPALHVPRLPQLRPDPRGRPGRAATGARFRPRVAAQRAGSAVAQLRRPATRDPGPRARAAPARPHEGQPAVDDPPADLSRLRGRPALRRARHRHRRTPVPRAVHVVRVQLEPDRRPAAPAQGRGRRRAGRLPPGESRPEGSHRDPRDLSARRPLPDQHRLALRERDGHPAPAGAPPGPHVRQPRDLRALHLLHGVPPPRPLHDTRAVADLRRSSPMRSARGATSGTSGSASRCSRASTSCSTSTRAIRHPTTSRRSKRRIAAATRAWVDDLRDALVGARGEEDGLEVLHQWGDAFPAAYRDDFDAEEALADLVVLRDLDSTARASRCGSPWKATTAPT